MKFALSTVVLAGAALGAPSYTGPAPVGYANAGYANAGYAHAAPAHVGYAQVGQAHAGYAQVGHAQVGHAQVGHQNVAVGVRPATHAVHEQVHLGQPIHETYVQHGVVGTKAVQVGSQPIQVGHQYGVSSKQVIPQQPYSYVAGEAKSYSQTRALPAPVLPVSAGPVAPIIPPAPVNYGPAPADTVTQTRVLAPVRTHTRITPRVTRIEPKLNVQQVPYEVRVNIPVPVHRDVIVQKKVAAPYQVNVPHPVPVAAPYKVHPVQNVVHTPIVREKTYSVHQPIVAAHHVAAAPYATAAVAGHY